MAATAIHPGEHLAEELKELGMSAAELARKLDVALAVMDQVGVATALLSISSPGVHFGNDEAARILARRVNGNAAVRLLCARS